MSGDIEMVAARIDALLKDETVAEALRLMKESAYQSFLNAKDDDARRMAQAEAKVLDTFGAALRAVVDGGERAKTERERREHAPVARD